MSRYSTSKANQKINISTKRIKKLVSKQIKNTLVTLLENSLFDEKYNDTKSPGIFPLEEVLTESISFYGILTNSVTKESDLIFRAQREYESGAKLVYYTVSKELFKVFPAAGTYLGPFTSCKPVFIEVLTKADDFYICKVATQLRYLELLSMQG